ncbi:DUF6382 domain-containing protein [Robertmurraya massiliosenegalensis]|uniref:DUF6382 domain-containing protein n=1 Tax=Robertmurraya massiliosenegalensis TaxID=1287657 RepID=UPI00030856CE|nr:DUF6382 domain-containing protein [Robertmurraya massiliosenegalensis]
MSKLYSFDYRLYDSGSKRFIEVFKNNPAITSEELDYLSSKMIQANSIPLLVPLEMEEINLDVTFHYQITELQTLTSYIQNRKITAKEFFELLNRLLMKLEASKEFMLNESKFVIQSDFIYVKNNLDDIRLLYLPLTEIPSKPPFQVELRDLMIHVIGSVTDLSGNGFQEILNYLKSDDFKIERLRDLLNQHIHSINSFKQPPVRAQVIAEQENKIIEPQREVSAPKTKKSSKKPFANKVKKGKKKDTTADRNAEEIKQPSERVKLITILAAIVVVALIWKTYLDYPSEGLLFVSSGLSILIFNIVFIILVIIKPGSRAVQSKKGATSIEKKKGKSIFQWKSKKSKNKDAVPNEILSSQVENVRQYQSPAEYYQNLQNQTTLLSKPATNKAEVAATVLLSDVEDKMKQYPYIELVHNGISQKVTIDKDIFIFGRNPEVCDYTLQVTGVSRTHFEIVCDSGGYGIRDLNSSNGTKLNDQKLVPHRIYPLKDEDIIVVAKQRYTFHREF